MSDIKIQPSGSGTAVVTLTAPTTNTARTITFPDATGTLLNSGSTLDATKLSGALPALSGASLTGVLPLAGGAMTGNITSAGNFSLDVEADLTLTALSDIFYQTTSTNSSAGHHIFKSYNTEIMRIHGGNNRVGINKTAPDAKLEIVSANETALACETTVSGEYAFIAKSSSTNATPIADFRSGSTSHLKVLADGRGLSQFTAKAWCNWNGTGTVAIQDSHNVSSVSDYGTGHYAPTYGTSMNNTNYGVYACGSFNSSNRDRHVSGRVQNAGSAECLSQAGSTATDNVDCYVLVFGD